LFISIAIGFASVILLQNLWAIIIVIAVIGFDLYWFYAGHNKKKPQYPLVPPEGKSDVYLPRSDIPRPIHADFREMQEKKRKLEKIRRLKSKKERKTK